MESTVFKCEVCNVTCTSVVNFKQHQEGAKHTRKLLEQTAPQEKPSILKRTMDSTPECSLQNKKPKLESKSGFRCDVCDKQFNGQEPYNMHMVGKAHQKKLQPPSEANCIQCLPCQKCFNGPVPYQIHLASAPHEQKVSGNPSTPKSNPNISGSGGLYCVTCNKQCNSSAQYEQHLLSNPHKRKVFGDPQGNEVGDEPNGNALHNLDN